MSRALRASHDTGRTDRLRRSIARAEARGGAGRKAAHSSRLKNAAAPNEVRAELGQPGVIRDQLTERC